MSEYKVPERKDVPEEYKWDLTSLFKDCKEWEQTLKEFEKQKESFVSFKGTLHSGKATGSAFAALRESGKPPSCCNTSNYIFRPATPFS